MWKVVPGWPYNETYHCNAHTLNCKWNTISGRADPCNFLTWHVNSNMQMRLKHTPNSDQTSIDFFLKPAHFMLIPSAQTIMHWVISISRTNLMILRKQIEVEKKVIFSIFLLFFSIISLLGTLRDEKIMSRSSNWQKRMADLSNN